jgi:hypothetical protein
MSDEVDQLERLEALLPELPGAVQRRDLGDRLNTSIELLRNADYQVGRLKALVEIAELTGMTSGAPARSIQELREEALDVGEALEDATTNDDLRDSIDAYKELTQRTLASSDIVVRNNWKFLAAQRFRPLGALGSLLQRIGVDEELGAKLAAAAARADKAGDLTPATAMCAEVKELLAELEELQSKRASSLSEGEIGAFIDALAEQRATVEMITPTVRKWLSENQALSRFSVVPL